MTNQEVINFGKYKGKNVGEIVATDPSYVLWANNNVSFFTITPEQIDKCNSNLKMMNYINRIKKDTIRNNSHSRTDGYIGIDEWECMAFNYMEFMC